MFGNLKRHHFLEMHILEAQVEVKKTTGRPARMLTELGGMGKVQNSGQDDDGDDVWKRRVSAPFNPAL